MDVTCSLAKNGEKLAFLEWSKEGQNEEIMSIDFLLPRGAYLNINLTENMMQGLVVLLDQVRKNAEWSEAVLVD